MRNQYKLVLSLKGWSIKDMKSDRMVYRDLPIREALDILAKLNGEVEQLELPL